MLLLDLQAAPIGRAYHNPNGQVGGRVREFKGFPGLKVKGQGQDLNPAFSVLKAPAVVPLPCLSLMSNHTVRPRQCHFESLTGHEGETASI